ncbi:S41 family peptidase [Desulfonema ishimotonii]|uniref:S41 family peptidase n=1 Tax=Desulfonema ishimotonii TaxID=45657 RepID=A0A401G1V1_9BACT|nr:S41 family peptidase [Desulfonema ishimotonii]GBC63199.1 S41 family peptidase [Desulfonema ishimotonii]
MPHNNGRHVKLWLAIVIAVVSFTIGTGFARNISASDQETYKSLQIFADVLDLIEKNYVDPVDSKDLIQKAIQGMMNGLDPHSQLLPPEAFEELQIDTKGEFGGIGIVITMQNRLLTVISPIEGTPAYKAGVKAGDIIIEVDGESTKDMMLWEAVKKMRGPKGEAVAIKVIREEEADPLAFTLVRDIIPIESVRYMTLRPGYGYVRITNFQDNTTSDLKNALKVMESGKSPLKGLVLDLRDNPGGLLNQAIDVSDLFLENGDIVSIKGRLKKHTKVFRAHANLRKRDFPIVVLINGGSASASEIVAGALQDHKRAVILGTTSFGKGSVQTVETLRDSYGLKFTIARYYTPSGRSIQAEGIKPDISVRHQVLTDAENAVEEKHWLKEKDLKNHLDAEPGSQKRKSSRTGKKDADEKQAPPASKTENRYGPLSLENLESDSQVMRALEILRGYQIFTDART